jgi:ribonuclease-3
MNDLEKILRYKFKDKHLLHQAITHSSITPKLSENYERLEFLGDRVLGVAVASMLYGIFKNEQEGNLSQRFMALVCKETVAYVAKILELDKFILSESIDVKNNDSVLSDVCEAVIGALYIDGGCEKAIEFVQSNWILLVDTHTQPPKDAKTLLQEVAHERNLSSPVYMEVGKEGSEHKPIFTMQVQIEGTEFQNGRGRNKKMAEQDAADKMLAWLGVQNGK